MRLALQNLGESVEQAPGVPWDELGVPGLPPFPQHLWDGGRSQSFSVHAPDHQIVSFLVVQLLLPVAHHPQVVPFPLLENAGESPLDSLVQILEQA